MTSSSVQVQEVAPGFPATKGAALNLGHQDYDALFAFYGMQLQGNLVVRRNAFFRFCGIPL